MPSLAPHNAPTNNAVTTGLIDGAVVSGIGTGKYSSLVAVSSIFYLIMFSSLLFLHKTRSDVMVLDVAH